ncbi:MAG: hypothetical protein JSS53_06370 [Proteobacteria bacterium]|nr:hypothetical protein [Pseudomonadota bacterium]
MSDKIKEKITTEIWNVYDSNTKTLSMVCRRLAFAEGGICWILKYPINQSCFSSDVYTILQYLIGFFCCDVLQYFFAYITYWIVGKYYEREYEHEKIKEDAEISRKPWMNYIPNFLFRIKIFFLFMASYYVVKVLFK